MNKDKKIKYFSEAWYFLQDHPLLEKNNATVEMALEIMVAKVNPKTGKVDKNDCKNTETEVWLEFGFPEYDKKLKDWIYAHDIRLDCGAETFEQAIVILAKLVKKYYK